MSDDLVGAIDCGTNSIKILIGRPPEIVLRDSRVVRLGQGVDTTGELADEALERTFAALEEFAEVLREHGVPPERTRFCATSAARDASNSEVFTSGVEARLGVRPEVLSGAEEAALVYAGAMSGFEAGNRPALVVDIGGGSTELVLGGEAPTDSVSMDIGSVRLSERHLHNDPPTERQVAECVASIDEHLDASGVDVASAAMVVGTSGTVKTIACGVLGLSSYDRDVFDGADISVDETLAFCKRLVGMSVEERRQLPYMHPGRADVIGAGALIWAGILRRATTSTYRVSEADILHGIAAAIA